jgi:hypothetical protein
MEVTAINTILNLPPRPQTQPVGQAQRIEERQETAEASATQENQAREVVGVETGVGELLSALAERIQGGGEGALDLTVSIDIIRANLGGQVANLFSAEDPLLGSLISSLDGDSAFSDASTNLRERLISTLAFDGLDNGALFDSSGNMDNGSIGAISSGDIDTRNLLYGLLVGELGTSRDEAIEVIRVLQQNPFDAVA